MYRGPAWETGFDVKTTVDEKRMVERLDDLVSTEIRDREGDTAGDGYGFFGVVDGKQTTTRRSREIERGFGEHGLERQD